MPVLTRLGRRTIPLVLSLALAVPCCEEGRDLVCFPVIGVWLGLFLLFISQQTYVLLWVGINIIGSDVLGLLIDMTRQVVFEYQPVSKSHFVLAQLLHWHNHGDGADPNQPFDDRLRGYVGVD